MGVGRHDLRLGYGEQLAVDAAAEHLGRRLDEPPEFWREEPVLALSELPFSLSGGSVAVGGVFRDSATAMMGGHS